MTKKDITSMVKELLKDIPKEEHIQTLKKIKSWLDDLIAEKEKNRTYCHNCCKYSLNKKFKKVTEKEIRYNVPIYIDSGYGDDDTHGDVEYIVTYSICPICSNKKIEREFTARILSEFDRQGNRLR